MDIARLLRHLACTRRAVRRAFPASALRDIEQAIAEAESTHDGQIRFVVEGALEGSALLADQSPRERAIELFSMLRIWDTEANNGVLIYLLLADRAFEVVADRGIHTDVGEAGWQAVCREMETQFARGNPAAAVRDGIRLVARHLAASTRRRAAGTELANTPVVLP